MRKINVIAEPPGKAESRASIDTPNVTDGSPKSKRLGENITSGCSPQLKKPLPQDTKPRDASKANSRVKLELVRSEGKQHRVPPDTTRTLRPDLTFQVEPFFAIARELPPLFLRHWEELATDKQAIPLEPDWDKYMLLWAQGHLVVMTMRAGDALIGYIFNLIGPHLHYRSMLHAEIEMFWLDPIYRGTSRTMRWFKANDDMLREIGVKRVMVAVKNHFLAGRVGSIFRRLGYLPVETNWSRAF